MWKHDWKWIFISSRAEGKEDGEEYKGKGERRGRRIRRIRWGREGAERRAKENILIIGYSHVTKNQKFIILT